MNMKKEITQEELKKAEWEEYKEEEGAQTQTPPPYTLRIVNEMFEVVKELKVYGKLMGKADNGVRHARFYDAETQTQYIRWNATDKVKLFIINKNPNQVLYVLPVLEKKKNKDGKEENYFFIRKNLVKNKEGSLV